MKLYHYIITLFLTLSVFILQFSFCTNQVGPDSPPQLNNDGNIEVQGSFARGKKISMYIVAISDNQLTYQWFKDNDSIKGAVENIYTIDSLTTEHEGIYRCVVTANSIPVHSKPYKLEIKDKIEQVLINYHGMVFSPGKAQIDKPFFLFIKPNKNLSLSYQWYKNDTKIEHANNDTLHFEALSNINEGIFYCNVINNNREEKSLNYIIELGNSPPVWINGFMQVKTEAGKILKLSLKDSCRDMDNDDLVFTIMDGKPDNDFISTDGIYEFQTILNDTGVYNVLIKASDGNVESIGVFKISVYYKIKEPEKPLLDNNRMVFSSGKPRSGEPFYLYIKPQKNLPMTYQWYKNDTIIEQATDDTLHFKALSKNNQGKFYCEVICNNNKDSSLAYIVEIGNNPPVWVNEIMSVRIDAGSLLKLSLFDSCNDGDDDQLSFILLDGKPDYDSIKDQGIYEYQSNPQDKGEFNVLIKASDGNVSSIGIIKILVHQENEPPEFRDSLPHDSYQLNEGDNLTIRFEAIDKNNDKVIYKLSQNKLPRRDEVIFDTTSKTLSWTSKKGDKGVYKIEIQASDGKLTTEKSIDIGIGEINLPPRISISNVDTGDTVHITENETLEFTVEISDPNRNDNPTFNKPENLPEKASFDLSSGKFTYIPGYDVSSEKSNKIFHSIVFIATDNAAKNPLHTKFVLHINVRDKKFLITAESDTGGSIDPSGIIKAEPGKDYTFTITPRKDWKIKDVLVNGSKKGAINKYTFTEVKRNNKIKAVFEEIIYTLAISSDENGKVDPEGEIKTGPDTSIIVTVKPDKGYIFKEWKKLKGNPEIKKLSNSNDSFEVHIKKESAAINALFIKILEKFTAKSIETGESHTHFLKADNTLWSSGRNRYGQLGDGTTKDRNSPVQVLDNVDSIITGKDNTFVILNNKTLWATGNNDNGQLGVGDTRDRKSFTKVNGIDFIKGISIGSKHTMIIKNDGTLWGAGHPGYIGLSNTEKNLLTFTQIPQMENVIKVCAGESFTIVLKADNTIWCVGKDGYGALGLGEIKEVDQFTLIPGINNVADIAAGSHSTFILQMDNSLWALGRNTGGQLGDGTSEDRNLPVKIMDDVRTISSKGMHTLILKTDNTLWATGNNKYGQFGNGSAIKTVETPVRVLDNVKSAKAGSHHSVVIKNDDSVLTAGENKYGELGIGDNKKRIDFTELLF